MPVWFPESWVHAAKDKGIQLENSADGTICLRYSTHVNPKSAKEMAVEQVLRVVQEVLPDMGNADLGRLGKQT